MATANSTAPTKRATSPVAASAPVKSNRFSDTITYLFEDLERIRGGVDLALFEADSLEKCPAADNVRTLLDIASAHCSCMDNTIDVLREMLDLPRCRNGAPADDSAPTAARVWLGNSPVDSDRTHRSAVSSADHDIDYDRLENLIAQAGSIVDLLRITPHGDSNYALPKTVENAAWTVQMMLFEMHEILFGKPIAPKAAVLEGGVA